jgi:hypothetical protein
MGLIGDGARARSVAENSSDFSTTSEPGSILKRASVSRSSGEWKDEDYKVLADS